MSQSAPKKATAEAQAGTDYKYYAFISYKHEKDGRFLNDASWAEALDEQLRFLHIPTEISREELIRDTDDTINPVYRDTTNLPMKMGGDLPKALEQSLIRSKTLIVIMSKDMIEDQNNRYNPDPNKSDAWTYWEVKTFLKHHDYDWTKIIPVYIEGDNYSPDKIQSKVIDAKKYGNIQKPWDDYHRQHDWENEKDWYYKRVACDIACSIFKQEDKELFWNVKERALKAEEAEKKRIRARHTFLIIGLIVAVGISLLWAFNYFSSRADGYLTKAKEALAQGNRLDAQQYAQKAYQNIWGNKRAAEVLWAASDSIYAVMAVNSPVSFDRKDSLFTYIEKNRYVVVKDASTYEEIERIDAGKAIRAQLSPSASRILVHNDEDGFRIYNRVDKDWEGTTHFYRSGSPEPVFSENDSVLCSGNEMLIPIHKNLYDDHDQSYTPASLSFIGTDSIFVVSRKHQDGQQLKGISIYLYDFVNNDHQSRYSNCLVPSAVLSLPSGTLDVVISPSSNGIVSYTEDQISTWTIECDDRGYSFRQEHSEPTQIPIREVRYCGDQDRFLVIDKDNNGYIYVLSSGSSRRLIKGYPYLGATYMPSIIAEPISIGPLNRYSVLYFLKGKSGVNITASTDIGYLIPAPSEDVSIRGTVHGGITCVAVTDEKGKGRTITYLFAGGDGRFITPQYTVDVLTSRYYVKNTNDILVKKISDGHTVIYSGASLFDARNHELLMHLSLDEDACENRYSYSKGFLAGDMLAATYTRRGDGSGLLRYFNIKEKSFIKESHFDKAPVYHGWVDDGSFFYSLDGVLYRDYPKEKTEADIFCEDYRYGHSYGDERGSFKVFGYDTKTGDHLWFSAVDGEIHTVYDSNFMSLDPGGDYYVGWGNTLPGEAHTLVILDSRTLDTLGSFAFRSDGWATTRHYFSRDYRSFLYSESKDCLCCMNFPSGSPRWKLDVWAPLSVEVGKRFAAIQSTSLYVIDIKRGNIVCEFETDPSREIKLALSPDETWLLAGDKLYSLKSKELIATGIDERYVSLENEHIVYRDRIMRLPNEKTLIQ